MAGSATEFFEDKHSSPNHEYLRYQDIGMRTSRMSETDWQEVDISGQVSTNCILRNPLGAAAMNCISEAPMAIATAKSGAAAFLHHANTPEEQKLMARDVYHHLAGIITSPLDAQADQTLGDVLTDLENREKDFRTLPVRDENRRCIGLLDETIFSLFDAQTKVSEAMHPWGTFAVDDIGLTPNQAFARMKQERAEKLVLLDASRRIGGLCLLPDIKRVVDSNPDEYSLHTEGDLAGRLIAFASVPTIEEEAIERIRLLKKYVRVFGIDTSHGEHIHAVRTLKAIKEEFSDIDIIAGNISTEETAREIAKLEPDGMQVGQGPGGICSSSDRLGFGTPQASAVYEVCKGAREIIPDMPIIADGGISEPADTIKAFAIGATAVKVGSLFAGTEETPVAVERDENGGQYRMYWGMGSKRAQEAFAAARARYGHYGTKRKLIFIEGFEKRMPLKGSVTDVIEEHVMGVKLSMAAQGFANQAEAREYARFMSGSNAGKMPSR